MAKQTVKSLIINITSWLLSITALVTGLLLLITDPIAGLIIIISSLILLPPIRKLYLKKINLRYRFAYAIYFVILITGFIVMGMMFEVDNEVLASSVSRQTPKNLEASSQSPEVFIKYSCGYTKEVLINGEKLNKDQQRALCAGEYHISLSDGLNSYEITFLANDAKYTEIVTIFFDKSAYEKAIADKEASQLKEKEEAEEKAIEQQRAEEEQRKEALIKAGEEAKAKLEAEKEAKRQTIGYAVSGISMKEIREEYDKQKDMSDYKGKKYLESLSGTKIIWVGKVSDVDDYILGEGNYIALSLSESLLDFDMGFVDVVKEEDKNLNKGTLIQVSGEISRVDDGLLGLSVYIKDVSIEVLK